ncbi:MAG: hypothetical protein UX62_C0007G0010 [Microgenomates group bacterium GW2011_GWA2_46_7]|nr:MAG: hypothetical protein UX64_C0017G0004 [Microgenomates group bacterium GW2011_GWC2_46_7]KKU46813.1 MAG: hypothetical protein UX62_C0007G0010 [Microgenomates group bacterium GW2011_GWA2_46_7]
MTICTIENIIFSYPQYPDPHEFIGWADHGAVQAGELKAEHTDRFGGSINMYRLVTFPGYRDIGIASMLLAQLTIWGHGLNATEIICTILPCQLVADTSDHFERYLQCQGFRHEGLLLKKYLATFVTRTSSPGVSVL